MMCLRKKIHWLDFFFVHKAQLLVEFLISRAMVVDSYRRRCDQLLFGRLLLIKLSFVLRGGADQDSSWLTPSLPILHSIFCITDIVSIAMLFKLAFWTFHGFWDDLYSIDFLICLATDKPHSPTLSSINDQPSSSLNPQSQWLSDGFSVILWY